MFKNICDKLVKVLVIYNSYLRLGIRTVKISIIWKISQTIKKATPIGANTNKPIIAIAADSIYFVFSKTKA